MAHEKGESYGADGDVSKRGEKHTVVDDAHAPHGQTRGVWVGRGRGTHARARTASLAAERMSRGRAPGHDKRAVS